MGNRNRHNDLAHECDRAKNLDRRFQFTAIIGGHRAHRPAQARALSQDHRQGPHPVSLVARAAQDLAVNVDHITVTKHCCGPIQHPPVGRIQRLWIDHPKQRTD